ncbi:hypothetical protein A0J61_08625 [Choanephora cucurbitarum]|uniref:Uncharacterized protein n=1 Tax=Choanephora cucurbitarum TaxID=101091 RepID=A0A1C7N3W7_9FUNG|nr:hypothetical protein A0J61_08625 [Choanephora cucurbitarum]
MSLISTLHNKAQTFKSNVCSGRGKSYCLVHRRYFETSWCPDCSRSSRLLTLSNCEDYMFFDW